MNAVIFTYPPDFAKAAIAARSLGKLGVKAFLAIDRKDPLPEIEGAEIIRTSFPRRGNLNGTDVIQGILRVLQECADDSDYVLKVDSDTLVRGLNWLEGHTEAAVGLYHPGQRIFFGACYALRVDRLHEYRSIAAQMPFSKSVHEDIEIGGMMEDTFTYENKVEDCPFAGYTWKSDRSEEGWKKYEVIVFQPVDGMKDDDIRREMLKFA